MSQSQKLMDAISLEAVKRALHKGMPEYFGRRGGFVIVLSFEPTDITYSTNLCPACARKMLERALAQMPPDAPHTHGPMR